MAATAPKKGSKQSFAESINETVKPVEEKVEVTPVTENITKNKGGRPSKGETKKISLAIPVDYYEGVETGAAIFFKGNITAYINALIKKDLEENLDKYKQFKEMIK